MKQTLMRLREPAVVVLLVVLGLRVLLAPASFAYYLGGAGGNGSSPVGTVNGSLDVALFTVTYTATDTLTVVLLVGLLATCGLASPTRHVRTLTVWSLVVTGLGVLLAVVASVAWIARAAPAGGSLIDAARVLLGLVVPVLAVAALIRMSLALPREVAALAVEAAPEPETLKAVEAVRDPANEPTWQPDVASGAAWLKAGDAASGAAASGWGRPGEAGGWLPQTEASKPPLEEDSAPPERDQPPHS